MFHSVSIYNTYSGPGLPFQTVKHVVTAVDVQPLTIGALPGAQSALLIQVLGQLKVNIIYWPGNQGRVTSPSPSESYQACRAHSSYRSSVSSR